MKSSLLFDNHKRERQSEAMQSARSATRNVHVEGAQLFPGRMLWVSSNLIGQLSVDMLRVVPPPCEERCIHVGTSGNVCVMRVFSGQICSGRGKCSQNGSRHMLVVTALHHRFAGPPFFFARLQLVGLQLTQRQLRF